VEVLKDRAGTLLDPSLSERFLSFLEDQDEIPRFDEYEETPPQA
jgi:hypothetical protein